MKNQSPLIPTRPVGSATWMMIIGIVFIAVNLRSPLTGVGSLIGWIRDDLHISNTLAGLITTLPLLAFAFFSPIAPKLSRKYGMERVIFVSIVMLMFGILLRSISGISTLYLGTAIIGLSISVSNVLIPALIKREFPRQLGMMTGVYSISMNLLGALASGISIPIAVGLGWGWEGALRIWAVMSVISILIWFPQLKKSRKIPVLMPHQTNDPPVSMWRSGLAWQVTLFMGIQSLLFYILVAWLPEIVMNLGVPTALAGWMLSILQLALLPMTFIIPIIAGRVGNQRGIVLIMTLFLLIGTLGLLYGSAKWIVLWIVILGIGEGCAFGLSMMFFALKTKTSHDAAVLSGMAQSIGYLLAAIGPILFGFLHDVTNGWTVPLMLLVACSALLGIVGLGAGRNLVIGSNQ